MTFVEQDYNKKLLENTDKNENPCAFQRIDWNVTRWKLTLSCYIKCMG